MASESLDPDNPWSDPDRPEPEPEILPGPEAIEKAQLDSAMDQAEADNNRWLWNRFANRLTKDGGLTR